MTSHLKGVIAAAVTPITADLKPDLERFAEHCLWLLDNGCDGLNICGTTGEATSFSLAQRKAIMDRAARTLPLSRLMAGTGAAALDDAVELTKHAAALGLAGALILPPFYYKGVDDDGIVAYVDAIVRATQAEPIDIYLYNFPALAGVIYSPALVSRLHAAFGSRMAGLKDSSGNLDYAAEIAAISPAFRVFPSNEGILLRARAGDFAGCISASANINSAWCAKAFHDGDQAALDIASRLRALVSRGPLIPGIKAAVASLRKDSAFEALMPPLSALKEADKASLFRDVESVIGDRQKLPA